MKFIFADSHDYVDPGFDFEAEEHSPDRLAQRDDVYAHEFFEQAPYDGILVSRATVGDERWNGKYSTSQSMRFRRDGARTFLRYDPKRTGGMLIGDCGAFSYVREPDPPYSVPEMADYYADCGFTHAVSVDHVILGYNEQLDGLSLFGGAVPEEWRRRYEVTLRLAEQFRAYCRDQEAPFVPIGVAQGWSPRSYATAVQRLTRDLGYDYVALGGMVPLKVDQIHRVLSAVRNVAPTVQLHLFGFTKADHLGDFARYNIESFDSTSPMLRAFKDSTKNYLASDRWYTAIRVPQADANRVFKQNILAGVQSQRLLRDQEERALRALRAYAAGEISTEDTLLPVVEYGRQLHDVDRARAYRETLRDRPWERCPCRACREAGIEVLIFRGSNRNRRRGFHNLWELHRQLRNVRDGRDKELTAHAH